MGVAQRTEVRWQRTARRPRAEAQGAQRRDLTTQLKPGGSNWTKHTKARIRLNELQIFLRALVAPIRVDSSNSGSDPEAHLFAYILS